MHSALRVAQPMRRTALAAALKPAARPMVSETLTLLKKSKVAAKMQRDLISEDDFQIVRAPP
jgi:hypothetical protein